MRRKLHIQFEPTQVSGLMKHLALRSPPFPGGIKEKLQIAFLRDAVGMLKLYSQANNSADQSTDGTGGNRKRRTSSDECDMVGEK